MSKKVYIIHGREGSPEHGRLYWLQEELNALGIETKGFFMPHPEIPTIDDRVQVLKDQIIPDSQTYIVAHSVGVQTAIRWLESLENVKIGWLLSVAWWFHLESLKDEELLIARPWIETHIDTEKVKQHCKQFVAIFSDNDPWVPVLDTEEFIQRLDAEVIIEHDMDHIYWLDPQRWYPLVKDIVLGMMEGDIASYQLPATSEESRSEKNNKLDDDWAEHWSIEALKHWGVMIRVLDRDGVDMGSFEASKHESILDTAEKNGIDIWYSCRSGACFACAWS